MRALLALATALVIAAPAAAQRTDAALGLPVQVRDQIDRLMALSGTVRYQGAARIGVGDRIEGSVVVTDGALTLAGQVRGHVVVMQGDLILQSGAEVSGDIIVVDGRMIGFDRATVSGTATVYDGGFAIEPGSRRSRRDRSFEYSKSGLNVGIGTNYNRVEGLPVHIGPGIQTGGENWLRLEAFAILRTEPGFFDTREMGYSASAEQRLPGLGGVSVGVGAASVIDPIEQHAYSNEEATFAAALFHEDLRDYYERTGWNAFLRFAPDEVPLDLRLEYRSEDHASAPLRDPWTLFRGDRLWRLQPLAGEGRIELVGGRASFDRLRGHNFSTVGWSIGAALYTRVGGELIVPAWAPVGDPDGGSPALAFDDAFAFGSIDVRRYQPVAGDGVLGLRLHVAGALEKAPLAPQFQHALGGSGSLPGYSSFTADCGARSRVVQAGAEQGVFPSYGCDRVALAQIEYRGPFGFRIGDEDSRWRHHDVDPSWVLFFDAGRGWSYSDGANGISSSTRTLYDAGAGIVLGELGLFGAVPLTGDSREVRLFLRLGPRF